MAQTYVKLVCMTMFIAIEVLYSQWTLLILVLGYWNKLSWSGRSPAKLSSDVYGSPVLLQEPN